MAPIESSKNRYEGRLIAGELLANDPEIFRADLSESLAEWRREGIRVVWLDLALEQSALVPVAVAAGFIFHSAIMSRLRLTNALVPGAHVPAQATHYVGAGGVVLRDDNLLLVVSERYRATPHERHLKLPGGALHQREHIVDAVRREIYEETGIGTRFRSLVCFRHWHGYRDDKSDIYFVCRLDPTSFDINRQADEIDECLWLPVEEFLDHEHSHVFNKRIVRAALEGEGIVPEVVDGYGTPESHELFMPRSATDD